MATTNTIHSVVQSPVGIIGAGPAGISMAAMLLQRYGIRSIVLERVDGIASLWQKRTYDCLQLRLKKQDYELPLFSFPRNLPFYITKQQLIDYFKCF